MCVCAHAHVCMHRIKPLLEASNLEVSPAFLVVMTGSDRRTASKACWEGEVKPATWGT